MNIKRGGGTSRITILTEVSEITGLMFCITTLKPTPIAQKTPQCQAFLGTLIFNQVVKEMSYIY
jgi:hypothetical protein